jgi:predicted acylesterase/phospholipase RssA
MNANPNHETTRFYSDCIGVFQGGGCCAAAFAGAYEEAYQRGVRFNQLAGTSAGSIAAALIAAGANPKYVLEKLGGLDFNIFLKPPERTL